MPIDAGLLKTVRSLSRRGRNAASWAALGAVVGYALGLFVDDGFVQDAHLAFIVGGLLGLVWAVEPWNPLTTDPARNLRDCLRDTERLGAELTRSEVQARRLKCLKKHPP